MAEGVKVEVQEDGLLWALNATLFHPRGFALAWDPESGEFTVLGDGTEPWGYAEGVYDQIDERFKAFEALLERARVKNAP